VRWLDTPTPEQHSLPAEKQTPLAP
jgi:hypothetical protein